MLAKGKEAIFTNLNILFDLEVFLAVNDFIT